MKRAWLLILAAVIGTGLLVSRTEFGKALTGRWSFTRSVEVDHGRYFRLKVDLAYKGEPLTFDIVVGCKVRVTTYKDNDRSWEAGVVPMAYGLKMRDGRGVVVHPPEACNGETSENGGVPEMVLPLIVTYENADEPWFGRAYASDDAYDSPLSELKFFRATINRATREEWQAWRRTEAPKNFVTYQILGINPKNFWDMVRWKPGYRAMGSVCTAFSRVKLPESARELVRQYWPTSRPDYWYPGDALHLALWQALWKNKNSEPFEGYQFEQYSESTGTYGLPRRQPGAGILYRRFVSGAVYPARSDVSFNRLDSEGNLPAELMAKPHLSWAEAEIRPELRGFAYCDRVENIANQPSSIKSQTLPYVNRINAEAIQEYPPRQTGHGRSNFDIALERDEYIYFYRYYSVANIFGGL
jgi:hypothetical protein